MSALWFVLGLTVGGALGALATALCVRAARREMQDRNDAMTQKIPATKTAHWPTGPVFVCDRHCAALERIGMALGMHLPITHAVPPGEECINCRKELAKLQAAINEADAKRDSP